MNILNDLHFLRPLWLLFIPVFALAWFVACKQIASAGWGRVISADKLRQLLVQSTPSSSNLYFMVPAVIAAIALAGPSWQQIPGQEANSVDVRVFVLDLSPSMLAQDVAPDRLTRAQHKLVDMLRLRYGQESALVVYAGDEHQVTPLTDDPATIEALVSTLHPDIMPIAGAKTEAAITLAIQLIEQAEYTRGDIILITDGLHADAIAAIRQTLTPAFRLSILGIGSRAGAPVPVQSGYLQDQSGNIVVARLNADDLKELAQEFNGRYSSLTDDMTDVDYLNDLAGLTTRRANAKGLERYDHYEDAGYWLVLLLIPVAVFGYRKNLLLGALLALTMVPAQDSFAFDWRDLWLNQNQRAAKALASGNNELAATLFSDKRWRAIALYRGGRYLESLAALTTPEYADDLYNAGNAQALAGDFSGAIKSYELALLLYSEDETEKIADAVHNLALVKNRFEKTKDEQFKAGGNEEDDANATDQTGAGADQAQSSADSVQQSAVGGISGGRDSLSQKAASDQNSPSTSAERQDTIDQQPATDTSAPDNNQWTPEEAAQVETDQQNDSNPVAVSTGNKVLTPYSEQWLRELPKDPGGYLRRKFYYEYSLRTLEAENAGAVDAPQVDRY